MQMTSDRELVPLRRTIRPYVGQLVILAAVTVFAVYTSVASSDWGFMWAAAVFLPLFGVSFLYFGMKYRVLWSKEAVVMRASGGAERRIPYDEISRVKNEVSSANDVLAQSRPFFRIAVYSSRDANAFVDISLRHFRFEDIQELLATIHNRRPDLDVPTISKGSSGRLQRKPKETKET
jgi:hypothetical protein